MEITVHPTIATTPKIIISQSTARSQQEGDISSRWKQAGNINPTGVHARVERYPRNTSSVSANTSASNTVDATSRVRIKFLSQVRFRDGPVAGTRPVRRHVSRTVTEGRPMRA